MHDHAHPHDTPHSQPAPGPRDKDSHAHVFLGTDHDRNARRTWAVIGITTAMMVIEIVAGTLYGSMALVADGWHMATHAAALLIAALSYSYARRNAENPRFTFGTGKFGDLAGFASAVILGMVALLIGWESFLRLANPVTINFNQATIVAVVGLVVNLGCAALLHDGHGHAHDHSHGHHHPVKDNNLRAAYLHVLADALTSVLAIAALLAGRVYGWLWLDPAIGILGALVIARWSFGLLKQAGAVLVDYQPQDEDLPAEITAALAREGDSITDLHVWQLGPGHHGAIIAVKTARADPPEAYRARLRHIGELSHVTVEVQPA